VLIMHTVGLQWHERDLNTGAGSFADATARSWWISLWHVTAARRLDLHIVCRFFSDCDGSCSKVIFSLG
jgi:hypothetical protein